MQKLLFKRNYFIFLQIFYNIIINIYLQNVFCQKSENILNNYSTTLNKPNIILLITDDQDKELGSMDFMPKTLKIFNNKGVEFLHGLVSTPICCPSRSSILTGKYVHNHNVMTNSQNCSSIEWRNIHEKKTFLNLLKKKGGYKTSYFGKYLNEYDGSYIPEGIDHFVGLIKNSRFYNYTLNINGKKIRHGDDYKKDYLTDKIINETINFIDNHINNENNVPFLSVLAFPAPHGPEDSAPQYSSMFEGILSHRTSSWNYAPNPDKQWILQRTGKMEPIHVVFTDLLHRKRLQTLQSVDSGIEKLVQKLRELDQLQNTFIIYTSDHGYHLGQFGLVKGKNMPFEFDIKVPFYIRGPGIIRNVKMNNIVSNIDIAPTILNIAGLEIDKEMDGTSFLPLILKNNRKKKVYDNQKQNITLLYSEEKSNWRHTLLIERGKMLKLKKIKDRFLKQKEIFNKKVIFDKACNFEEYHNSCLPGQKWKCIKNKNTNKWTIIKCKDFIEINNECICDNKNTSKKEKEIYNIRDKRYIDKNIVSIMNPYILEILSNWEIEFIKEHFLNHNSWHQGIIEIKKKRNTLSSANNYSLNNVSYSDAIINKESIPELAIDVLCLTVNSIYCESQINFKIKKLKKKLLKIRETKKKWKNMIKCNCSFIFQNYNDTKLRTEKMKHHLHYNDNLTILPDIYLAKNYLGNKNFSSSLGQFYSMYKNLTEGKTKKGQYNSCNVPQMNCFTHDSTHWKTEPLWPDNYGKFCFCQNTNNNTYWCLRTYNETHNFLYCEFITGFISYYDINKDPSQLSNIVYSLDINILEQLSTQLQLLKNCKGINQCEHYSSKYWYLPLDNKEKIDKNSSYKV
uniref:5-formyltetrahydrofolate cyclo-ligase n=1 Tax=Strongyloides stercoralis TaxID=6248 RepID=A0A0K0EII4_STRER